MRTSCDSRLHRGVEDIPSEKDESISFYPSIAHPDVLFPLGPFISDVINGPGKLSYANVLLFLRLGSTSLGVVTRCISGIVTCGSVISRSRTWRCRIVSIHNCTIAPIALALLLLDSIDVIECQDRQLGDVTDGHSGCGMQSR